MSNNKPIIGALISMLVMYLLISFVVWDLNTKNWQTELRLMYSFWSPIISLLIYISIRADNEH